MDTQKLSTEPYKGVRDFYPKDMAVQDYIFTVWRQTAERFGFEHYEASVLERAELYKAKGAENAEMVNEQTYTFTDRGDREVTLRPEMTPTAARMIAARSRELAFPVRWYSIPNLFRYERAQRGRLREHWQLNCDIFGASSRAADVELITLAYQVFINFGATPDMFEILINNRATMNNAYKALGITNPDTITAITRLNDRKDKISSAAYQEALMQITESEDLTASITAMIESPDPGDNQLIHDLAALGITNVRLDRSLARGFDYYTGTVFEVKDTHPDNRRSLLGGGRYDNLTALFSKEPVSGIGFGFGDVTMRDFLVTHELLSESTLQTAPMILVVSTDTEYDLAAQKVANAIRSHDLSVATDYSARKTAKKLTSAKHTGVLFTLMVGPDETHSATYTLHRLTDDATFVGGIDELVTHLKQAI